MDETSQTDNLNKGLDYWLKSHNEDKKLYAKGHTKIYKEVEV